MDNSSLAGAYYETFLQDFLSNRHLECGSITFFSFLTIFF